MAANPKILNAADLGQLVSLPPWITSLTPMTANTTRVAACVHKRLDLAADAL